MGKYVKKKKEMVFQSVDSLQQVVNVVNEASAALQDDKDYDRDKSKLVPEKGKNGYVMRYCQD